MFQTDIWTYPGLPTTALLSPYSVALPSSRASMSVFMWFSSVLLDCPLIPVSFELAQHQHATQYSFVWHTLEKNGVPRLTGMKRSCKLVGYPSKRSLSLLPWPSSSWLWVSHHPAYRWRSRPSRPSFGWYPFLESCPYQLPLSCCRND